MCQAAISICPVETVAASQGPKYPLQTLKHTCNCTHYDVICAKSKMVHKKEKRIEKKDEER